MRARSVVHGKNLEIGCGAANPAWEGPLWGSPSPFPQEEEPVRVIGRHLRAVRP